MIAGEGRVGEDRRGKKGRGREWEVLFTGVRTNKIKQINNLKKRSFRFKDTELPRRSESIRQKFNI